jgi:hypothetical protein
LGFPELSHQYVMRVELHSCSPQYKLTFPPAARLNFWRCILLSNLRNLGYCPLPAALLLQPVQFLHIVITVL